MISLPRLPLLPPPLTITLTFRVQAAACAVEQVLLGARVSQVNIDVGT